MSESSEDFSGQRSVHGELEGDTRSGLEFPAGPLLDAEQDPALGQAGGQRGPDPAIPAGWDEEAAMPTADAEIPLATEPSSMAERVAAGGPSILEPPLFSNYQYTPPPPPPRRKPDFGDCLLFAVLAFGGSLCSGVLVLAAMHFHLLGVSTYKQANEEIHYRIGAQAGWYILTLLFCVVIFPLVWRRNFFEGLQWRANAAKGRLGRLIGAATACFVAAILDQFVMPGPANTPIDQTFRMPGAVWLLFGFGVTLAPLIEEIAFRGLLLPAVCTGVDWLRSGRGV